MPQAEDFSPECFTSYELFYDEDEEYTTKCNDIIDKMKSHGGLLLKMTLAEFKEHMKAEHKDLPWYMLAYNDLGIDTTPRDGSYAERISSVAALNASIASAKAIEVMANPKKQSAHTRTYKQYQECIDLAKTEEDMQLIIKALNGCYGTLLGRQKKENGKHLRNENGCDSYPEVETRKNVTRYKPTGENYM